MPLAQRVVDTIRRHALPGGGADRVLVALSGGADSVALLLLLRELERQGVLAVAGAAHLNHQLRGADSNADEAFCVELAGRIGIPIVTERADIAALAREQKRSIEDAARTARYAFLERAAGTLRADVIAVGHTLDDQAETFLLRLLRGAGTRGLAAIHPRVRLPVLAPSARKWVIRPLLDVHRAELRDYLAAACATFREDASNADVAFERNRVRHELLPLLRSRFSPAIDKVLAREAALARQDEEFLSAEAIKLASRIVLTDVDIRIDAAGLAAAPRALSSRVALVALQRLAGPRFIHFEHVERLLALAESANAGAVSLPGQNAVRVGDEIRLRPRVGRGLGRRRSRRAGSSAVSEGGTRFAFSLSIPGEVALTPEGVTVAAEYLMGTAARKARPTQWAGRGAEVGIAAGALALPLTVRSRRAGDRFRPLGSPGKRKLQDFMVDRKIPREQRDTVPLVVDGQDRIVWVVGQSVAEEFRVTDPSLGVILLKVRHLGGVG